MKKSKWSFVSISILLFCALIFLVACGATQPSIDQRTDDSWIYIAERRNGIHVTSINFTADELSALHLESSNERGEILLTLTQGSVSKEIDISDGFNGHLDMSDFEPGRITFRLQFDSARQVNIAFRW